MPEKPENTIFILLIEDNEDHAMITIDFLKENNIGDRIFHCENGQIAIDYLSKCIDEDIPDLILLDIKMPLKNGYEVLEFIRSQNNILDLPVVILSTTQNEIEVKKAYKLGANSFVMKPLEFSEFNQVIKNLNFY